MSKKRNPTEHTEERSGSAAAPGSQNLPEGAEQAEFAGYDRQDEGDSEGGAGEAEARREASLQPGGEVEQDREKESDENSSDRPRSS